MNETESLQAFLQQAQQRTGVPGIVAAVHVGGRTIAAAVGVDDPANGVALRPDARFDIGCIMKLMLSLSALELVARGELDLEEPIDTSLTELRHASRCDGIRVWHLLTNTSGLLGINRYDPRLRESCTWEHFFGHVEQSPRLFEPGTVFNYLGDDFVLLGEILRRRTGAYPAELVTRNLKREMGLEPGTAVEDVQSSGEYLGNHRLNPESRRYEAIARETVSPFWQACQSDITLSAPALVAFADRVMAKTREVFPRGRDLLFSRLTRLPAAHGKDNNTRRISKYGLGCAAYADGTIGHAGSTVGQCCTLRFNPDRGLAIAVAMNAPLPAIRDVLAGALINAYQHVPQRAQATEPGHFIREELVGDYVGGIDGMSACIQPDGRYLKCHLALAIPSEEATGNFSRSVDVWFALDDQGAPTLRPDSSQMPLSFFHEPGTGAACIMAGLMAFRRVA